MLSLQIQETIQRDIYEPSVVQDITRANEARERWKKLSSKTESASQIFVGASTILAFAAGFFDQERMLSFLAGCSSTVALVFAKFSTYAAKNAKGFQHSYEKLLQKCNIQKPIVEDESKSELNSPE